MTYLDMAMTLSHPHPQRPYELPGMMLGEHQLAAPRAVAAGGAARAGRDRRGARAVGRVRALRRRRAVLEVDEVGVRDGADLRRGGLRLRAHVLDLDDDRGVPEPAADLGARARLLHDRARSPSPRCSRSPRGSAQVECVNVEHEEVVLIPRAVQLRARHVQVRARPGVHRGAAHAAQTRAWTRPSR